MPFKCDYTMYNFTVYVCVKHINIISFKPEFVLDLTMASSSRHYCQNKPDSFGYICATYTFLPQKRNITSFVRRAYKTNFQVSLGDQEKKWVPHIVCHNREEMLRDWTKGKRKSQPFGIPMVWREPKDHSTDCYFCLVNIKGVGRKSRQNISYPSISSAIRPVPHSGRFPPPIFNGFVSSDEASESEREEFMECEYKETDTKYEDSSSETKLAYHQFNQSELNDLVCDLDLSKQAAELLASGLNEKHLQRFPFSEKEMNSSYLFFRGKAAGLLQ